MPIITGYSGCLRDEIMEMSEKELREAIIRAFSVKSYQFLPGDSWIGSFVLEDEIADAFRGRC